MAAIAPNGSTSLITTATVLIKAVVAALLLNVLYRVLQEAYNIRLYAITEFGPVIHEFDPYFNFRATEVSNS